ncbi:MAG: c-type cytochrome [Acidobacteria bacterium]|nr:c-type cytochrome [Acidobacteriota bacterium]
MRHMLLFLTALPVLAQGPHDAVADLSIGKRVFESQCALCHGADGSGGRGPSLRKAKLKNAPDDEALRKAISEGLPPEMPGAWQLSVREVASVAGYVRSLGKIAVEEVPGDSVRGKALFTERGCSGCHIVNGQGNGAGPELSAIGARRSAAHLRESIVRPSATVPDDFLLVEITDGGGHTIKGVKANEDLFTIQIALPGGRYQSFSKSTIKKLTRLTGQSTMPAFDKLPANDLDNLVAYLASLRGAE